LKEVNLIQTTGNRATTKKNRPKLEAWGG